jgi:hypothetical protein
MTNMRTILVPPAQVARRVASQVRPERKQANDYVVVSIGVGMIALVFFLLSPSIRHWFILALIPCGVLAGVDVVRCLRGKLDVFDPKAIVGFVAFHGLFLAPLLSIAWDWVGLAFGRQVFSFPGDPRPWFGGTALLNVVGLVLYRVAHNTSFRRTCPSRCHWLTDRKRFFPVLAVGGLLGVAAQAYLLMRFEGAVGIAEAYEAFRARAFEGLGWLQAFSWPVSVLLAIAVLVWVEGPRRSTRGTKFVAVLLIMGVAAVGHFVVQGLYGSRSSVVWALVWLAAIVHYRLARLSRKTVGLAGVILLLFMYFYGFYKERGREATEVLADPALWLEPYGYRRDFKSLVVGDLARFNSEAFILHNLLSYPKEYDYRLGLTYVGAAAVLLPRALWPEKPDLKAEAGTEVLYGKGYHGRSSLVYGLAGEGLLNFGPLGIPVAFAVYGALLGWYRRKLSGILRSDSRTFLLPFFAILFLIGFVGDSDNVAAGAAMRGGFVAVCIWAASSRTRVRSVSPGKVAPRPGFWPFGSQ